MKRELLLLVALIAFVGLGYLFFFNRKEKQFSFLKNTEIITSGQSFELHRGDILVRPNWSWLPGSFHIPEGRKFGHVALVVQGASGRSVDEVLNKSIVFEALFYDQASSRFEFDRIKQIREINALTSFGHKFKGVRYRLRPALSESAIDSVVVFYRNQLGGGYQIFSAKQKVGKRGDREKLFRGLRNGNWHCATLVWEAIYLATGLDLDVNQGMLVYPSDLIGSELFDSPGGRVRF